MDATEREEPAQAGSAVIAAEKAIRDLMSAEKLSNSPVAQEELCSDKLAPLVQRVGAPSLAEFERMLGELIDARTYLEAEGARVRREADRYLQLAQTASESVRVISDAISEWRSAGHPLQ